MYACPCIPAHTFVHYIHTYSREDSQAAERGKGERRNLILSINVLYKAHLQVSMGDSEGVEVVNSPQHLMDESTGILLRVAPLGYDTIE